MLTLCLLFELGIPGEALRKPSRGHPGSRRCFNHLGLAKIEVSSIRNP